MITDHRLELDHEFNWNDVTILDNEPLFNKRLVSEMIFIKRQKNSLNMQTDTEFLLDIYTPIINKLSKF